MKYIAYLSHERHEYDLRMGRAKPFFSALDFDIAIRPSPAPDRFAQLSGIPARAASAMTSSSSLFAKFSVDPLVDGRHCRGEIL